MWHNVRVDHPSFSALPEGVLALFRTHGLHIFYRRLKICLSEANLRIFSCGSLLTFEHLFAIIPRYFIGNPAVALNFSGFRDCTFASNVLDCWNSLEAAACQAFHVRF